MILFAPNSIIKSADHNANNAELKANPYPIGSIYLSVNSSNPSSTLGFGTWVAFATGRTLVGVDTGDTDFNTVEKAGGGKTHSHTTGGQSADHSHGYTAVYRPAGGTAAVPNGSYYAHFEPVASNTGGASGNHTHSMGSGVADSTVQPCITVYMWKRTA